MNWSYSRAGCAADGGAADGGQHGSMDHDLVQLGR
jgi:hypothetical protein